MIVSTVDTLFEGFEKRVPTRVPNRVLNGVRMRVLRDGVPEAGPEGARKLRWPGVAMSGRWIASERRQAVKGRSPGVRETESLYLYMGWRAGWGPRAQRAEADL